MNERALKHDEKMNNLLKQYGFIFPSFFLVKKI